jgi:phospholipase/lecithinase/hemolysin
MSARSLLFALALLLLVLQPIAALATAPTYDAIYVFGDSYCDVGNLFILTGGAKPAPPYYNGRFSNGPIWVEHLAGSFSLPMLPALSPGGGTDYAFGGAEVINPIPIAPGVNIPNVPQQVALYLSQHGGKADPKALYILEGGGNDIVDSNGVGSPDYLGFQIALGISGVEVALRRAGAKNFLIPNLFDVSHLPVAKPIAPFAQQASLATNKYLDSFLLVEQLIQGMRIRRIDVYDLIQAVFTDTTHFGFTDVTDPCLTTTICADPDHTYFWDVYHPTVFGHSLFAASAVAALSQ